MGGWLALALLIHAILLLMPMGQPVSSARKSNIITITLSSPVEAEVLPDLEPSPRLQKPSALPPAVPERDPEARPVPDPAAVTDPAEIPPATVRTELLRAVTLARLIESLHQGELDTRPNAPARTLGAARSGGTPPHWRQNIPGAMPGENLFDGKFAPARTEIVDRWMAADGSQNVVINLPNGETLCGRAESWDPMRPMVEHVMMFRSCGGGGERTFTMSPRLSREIPRDSNGRIPLN